MLHQNPVAIKQIKLYDDNYILNDQDLQDALEGILKLGLSTNTNNNNNNNTNNHTLPTSAPTMNRMISTESKKSPTKSPPKPKRTYFNSNNNNFLKNHSFNFNSNSNKNANNHKHKHTTSTGAAGRHNLAYRQKPNFIGVKRQQYGLNMLLQAAMTVEPDHFKMDASDVNNKNITFDDLEDVVYDKNTFQIKQRSKNAIVTPKIDPNELLNDDDLDNSYHRRDSLLSLRHSIGGISSIGRRSSINGFGVGDISLLDQSPNINDIEIQKENRRSSREWSKRNIKEIDQIFHDKNKLRQKLKFNDKNKMNNIDIDIINDDNNKSIIDIIDEFDESNKELTDVFNKHKANIKYLKQIQIKKNKEREKQNDYFQKQLRIMELKIEQNKQYQKDKLIQKQLLIQKEKEKQRQLLLQKQQKQKQKPPPKPQQPRQPAPQPQQPPQQPAAAAVNTVNIVNNNSSKNNPGTNEMKEWYPHESDLNSIYKKYRGFGKQIAIRITNLEKNNPKSFGDFEFKIGLILRSISSNSKSVLESYQRFRDLVNTTSSNSDLRLYCFVKITELIITDTRIIRVDTQKYASSFFLSFIFNEFYSEYIEIFQCIFYNNIQWLIPYIAPNLNKLNNNISSSIERCVILSYKLYSSINQVPKEKQEYLQIFNKKNNTGTSIFESEYQYFNKINSICALYSAFMTIRNSNQFKNPIGVDSGNCWEWLSSLIQLPVCIYPELSAILSGILPVFGHDMLEKYPNQFPKILKFIHNQILTNCDQSTPARKKFHRELTIFFKTILKNGKLIINKPKNSKLIKQTVGIKELTNI